MVYYDHSAGAALILSETRTEYHERMRKNHTHNGTDDPTAAHGAESDAGNARGAARRDLPGCLEVGK